MAILATDNFDRADAANLGANWVLFQGIGNHQGIFSNAADLTVASNRNGDIYDGGVTWPNDQYVKATCVVLPDATGTWAVVVRGDATSGTLQRTMYAAGVAPGDTGNFQTRIWKWVANVFTLVATSGTVDISAGNVVELDIQGTTLTCFVQGVQKIQTTDSSITNGKPGIYSVHNAIDVALFNNFEAGDFSVPGGSKGRYWTLLKKSRK